MLRAPGHLLGLGCQHTDAVDVFLEGELHHGGGRLLIGIVIRLGNDEGINLHSLPCDEHSNVPLAVVAQLTRSADVAHFSKGVISQEAEWKLRQTYCLNSEHLII